MNFDEWKKLLELYLDDYFVNIVAAATIFTLGASSRFLVLAAKGILSAIRRWKGQDTFSEIYGNWFYYRRTRAAGVIEVQLKVKPSLFSAGPIALFDTAGYLWRVPERGRVGKHEHSFYFLFDKPQTADRGQQFLFPFLIAFGNRPPEVKFYLGFATGRLVTTGSIYSAKVVLSRSKLDANQLESILPMSQSIEYGTKERKLSV